MPKTVKTANGKKTRKKKDPSKPKGKRSAFVFFSSAVHAQVKAENPGFGFGEVVREIARQWKLVKDTPAAAPYRKKAEEDAVRYNSEKATWKPAPAKAEADHDDELSNETVSGGEAKTPASLCSQRKPLTEEQLADRQIQLLLDSGFTIWRVKAHAKGASETAMNLVFHHA